MKKSTVLPFVTIAALIIFIIKAPQLFFLSILIISTLFVLMWGIIVLNHLYAWIFNEKSWLDK